MSSIIQVTNLKARAAEIDAQLKADGVPSISDADGLRELLGFENVRSAHRAIERGDLAAFKVGNRWRVRRAAVAEFIARRENS